MKRNLAMTAAMFDVFNTAGLFATTVLLSGTPRPEVLRDPKYILNGVFYYTNTLIADLIAANNKIVAKYSAAQPTASGKGIVTIAGNPAVTVVANGTVSWFITMIRASNTDLTSPGYGYIVFCGSVGTEPDSDLIVGRTDIQLGSIVSVSPRKIRMIGHEQSP